MKHIKCSYEPNIFGETPKYGWRKGWEYNLDREGVKVSGLIHPDEKNLVWYDEYNLVLRRDDSIESMEVEVDACDCEFAWVPTVKFQSAYEVIENEDFYDDGDPEHIRLAWMGFTYELYYKLIHGSDLDSLFTDIDEYDTWYIEPSRAKALDAFIEGILNSENDRLLSMLFSQPYIATAVAKKAIAINKAELTKLFKHNLYIKVIAELNAVGSYEEQIQITNTNRGRFNNPSDWLKL